MKVIILNTFECIGGAAVAANRLMNALLKIGIWVSMLVRESTGCSSYVLSVNNSFIRRNVNKLRFLWERWVIYWSNKFSKVNLFQVSIANTGVDITHYPNVKDADIIHVHWINQGFLSLKDIQALIKLGKPIVWTLHDLWPATGICHYPGNCLRYQSKCFECPLQIRKPWIDLAKCVYEKKIELNLSKITFVGCSEWITNEARKSVLLKDASFLSIPNPIDISVFKAMDKTLARDKNCLPQDKFLLLFAAAKISDTRKGISLFINACNKLKEIYASRIEIVLMGSKSEELVKSFPFKVNALGYISDIEVMTSIYSAADMFIIPSLEDNLPNTIMESMACGTPCVGFDTGGIPEMIDHKINGYVAKYKDSEDLAVGIQWVLENSISDYLKLACLNKVKSSYSESVVADKYLTLYKSLLEKQQRE